MIQQVSPPARGRAEVFADAHQQGFDVGALGMTWVAWPALVGRISALQSKRANNVR
jgi:hypothetical protein